MTRTQSAATGRGASTSCCPYWATPWAWAASGASPTSASAMEEELSCSHTWSWRSSLALLSSSSRPPSGSSVAPVLWHAGISRRCLKASGCHKTSLCVRACAFEMEMYIGRCVIYIFIIPGNSNKRRFQIHILWPLSPTTDRFHLFVKQIQISSIQPSIHSLLTKKNCLFIADSYIFVVGIKTFHIVDRGTMTEPCISVLTDYFSLSPSHFVYFRHYTKWHNYFIPNNPVLFLSFKHHWLLFQALALPWWWSQPWLLSTTTWSWAGHCTTSLRPSPLTCHGEHVITRSGTPKASYSNNRTGF